MADDSKEIFAILKAHFEQLMRQNTQLQEKCVAMQEQVEQLQADIRERDEKIEKISQELAQCELRYKNLQVLQKSETETQSLQVNRERFARLVREIDKCISLLNE